MATFTSYSAAQINRLQDTLKAAVSGCPTYEQAAQQFVQVLTHEMGPSLVLARVYATVPFQTLPEFNRKFVTNLGKAKGVSHLIKDSTPVLSLMGTSGQMPAWRDRRQSQGHVGIPLCSSEFINEIPMMSRLMQELGLNLSWFDQQDLSLAEKSMTGMSGLFYVEHASQDTDSRQRKIISAQDFVSKNHVDTVFGMGTPYISGEFVICILFTTEDIAKRQAKLFFPLINVLRSATTQLVTEGRLFV